MRAIKRVFFGLRSSFWLYKARETPLFWLCLAATASLIGAGGVWSVHSLIKWLTRSFVEIRAKCLCDKE
jgi:hypothetical protein